MTEAEAGSGDDADEGLEEPDPYKRRVVVVLALLGVLGAWIGVLRIDSANNEATYARETTRTAIQSLRANVNQFAVEGLEIDLDAEQASLATELGIGAAAVDLDAQLADDTDGLGAQEREALAREQTFESSRLDLTRKALAETRVTYNNRTSQYETVLTTLAVALFLVGFSLVLDRRTRPPVLVPGLLLAAYVAVWAVHIHQRPVPRTDPETITATAEATTHRAFGELEQATARYSDALALDGDFRPAYTGRAISSFLTANPDWSSTLAVVTTDGPAVERARADAEEAARLGRGRDATSLVVSGLLRFYEEDYDGAAAQLDEAAGISGTSPEIPLVTTAVELARGDAQAAEAALERAVGLLDLDEASQRNRTSAANLFTLLEQVEHLEPDRADAVDRLRARLAAGEAELVFGTALPGRVPEGVDVTLDRIEVADEEVTATFTVAGLPEDTAVSVYVYEQPIAGAPFAQAPEVARLVRLGGSRTVTGEAELVRVCRPVNFRVDVYVDGAAHDSVTVDGVDPTC